MSHPLSVLWTESVSSFKFTRHNLGLQHDDIQKGVLRKANITQKSREWPTGSMGFVTYERDTHREKTA